jgi:Uncharacterized protein conserved in bacteria
MKLVPYIVMQGNAEEAVQFYRKVLDAEAIFVQRFGDMPSAPGHTLPEGMSDKIAHAHLKAGDAELMLYDTFPGSPIQQGNQVTICIQLDNVDKSKRIFALLKEGGQVRHELEETFFSPAFGTVTDKFGVTFTVSTDPQPS